MIFKITKNFAKCAGGDGGGDAFEWGQCIQCSFRRVYQCHWGYRWWRVPRSDCAHWVSLSYSLVSLIFHYVFWKSSYKSLIDNKYSSSWELSFILSFIISFSASTLSWSLSWWIWSLSQKHWLWHVYTWWGTSPSQSIMCVHVHPLIHI